MGLICYSNVIMGDIASQITSLTIVYSTVYSGAADQNKNIKARCDWRLCEEFTGDQWIPTQVASNAEKVSIWWRHYVSTLLSDRATRQGYHHHRMIPWQSSSSFSVVFNLNHLFSPNIYIYIYIYIRSSLKISLIVKNMRISAEAEIKYKNC